MSEIKRLTSIQNPNIKKYLSLREKARERKSKLVCFGRKTELELAIQGDFTVETLLYCPDILSSEEVLVLINRTSCNPEIFEISSDLYKKLVVRKTTEGVVAILKAKEYEIDQLSLRNAKPLILVAESPEKPGNIGALLRTADAAGLDAVLIANYKGDLSIRILFVQGLGCVFTVPVGLEPLPK